MKFTERVKTLFAKGTKYSKQGGVPIYSDWYFDGYKPNYNVSIQNWDDYMNDEVYIRTKQDIKYQDKRRAISPQSPYYNVYGIPREDFDQVAIDIIRKNPYYLLLETAMCNYLRGVTFDVTDKDGEHVDYAYDFLTHPNPQEGFWDCFLCMVRDLVAYDAGVLVKTFTEGGYLGEIKSYPATEFWGKIDRQYFRVGSEYGSPSIGFGGTPFSNPVGTMISHGYVVEWWQRAAVSTFIRYQPEEICYFKQYPKSTSIYGTAPLSQFKYHFGYLIKSTIAGGKIMDNGLNAGLVMTHPDIKNVQVLESRLSNIKKDSTGADNFGKTLHLMGNEDVKTVSHNLVDMEWIKGQQFIFKVVMNLFGFPASEFSMDDISAGRASMYISRNIMRSRMLSTILSNIEDKINREILPHMRGYRKGWKFSFQRSIDLDDQTKTAHIMSTRASGFSMFASQGIPVELSLKLAGFGDELTPLEKESLDQQIEVIYGRDGQLEVVNGMAGDLGVGNTAKLKQSDRAGRYIGNDTYIQTDLGYDASTDMVNNQRALIDNARGIANQVK